MENIQATPVSQYAQYADFLTFEASNTLTTEEAPLVELPTDEINIEKAAEVDAAIAYQRELVQQYISTLKELTNNPEVQKALEFEGLTVDFEKVNQTWNDGIGFDTGIDDAIVRPLTEEEKVATEDAVACACTDCVEAADNDVDTDTMLIIHDLSERLTALEERIALFNVKSSHKI
jgi:hypothetical protein